jgi:hypothetical protein
MAFDFCHCVQYKVSFLQSHDSFQVNDQFHEPKSKQQILEEMQKILKV